MATYSSFKRITSDAITSSSVTGAKIGALQVTTDKLDSNSVRTTDIQDGAVGTNELAGTVDFSGKTMTYRPFVDGDFANGSIAAGNLASGAITTNLGYTPLNRAGGTHSGTLTLPAGSVGAPSLASASSTNTGVYFPSSSSIALAGNGDLEALWNSAGVLTEPNKPAFIASGSGGWYYANSFPGGPNGWRELTGAWTWSTFQQGGSNIGANGRFTAPVAGYYFFYCSTYWYNDTNDWRGYTHWAIGRNGGIGVAGPGGRAPHTMYGHHAQAHHIPGINMGLTMWMNQGDYAIPQPFWNSANLGRCHGDYTLWCGFLVG